MEIVHETRPTASDGNELTVIHTPGVPLIHAIFAFALWIGTIHLFFALVFAAIFLLPLSKSVMVFALLLVLIMLPVEADSTIGLKVRRYIFENVCGYFPTTLHAENLNEMIPTRAYILAYEPHSVLPVGLLTLMHLTKIVPLPKAKVLASSAVFRTPFLRHIWTWMGLADASKKNFKSLLSSGFSCAIVPGGARETLYMVPDHEIVFIKARKGFVRMAIETGAPLIPIFGFGQTKVYNWWRPTWKWFVTICGFLKFTPMFFWGVWGTPLPYRVPMQVVMGKQIQVTKNPHPTSQEVDEVHGRFMNALEDLFERHKSRVGYPDRQLTLL